MLDFSQYKCEFCGASCTQIIFAAFVCDKKECVDAAREIRGGPGGHMARKAIGKPVVPEDVIDEDEKKHASFKHNPCGD